MNNNVDYDEMFGTDSAPKTDRERQYEERCRQDAAERNGLTETVEDFRRRPKNRESFFDRSDTFTELQEARDPFSRYRRRETSFLDLFAVITWLLTQSKTPVIIAGLIGFIAGLVLQFHVHDGLSGKATFKRSLPAVIVAVIVAVYSLFTL